MQGSNYQIDKGPLINIPIRQAVSDIQNKIILLAKNIIIKNLKIRPLMLRKLNHKLIKWYTNFTASRTRR